MYSPVDIEATHVTDIDPVAVSVGLDITLDAIDKHLPLLQCFSSFCCHVLQLISCMSSRPRFDPVHTVTLVHTMLPQTDEFRPSLQ